MMSGISCPADHHHHHHSLTVAISGLKRRMIHVAGCR